MQVSHPPHRRTPRSPSLHGALVLLAALPVLAACVSTTVQLSGRPADMAPPCRPAAPAGAAAAPAGATTLLLWTPGWRADQKDVPARERAAEQGLVDYIQGSTCFARFQLRRVDHIDQADVTGVRAQAHQLAPTATQAIVISVHELGPVLRLLSSAALVDGGTEVVLGIRIVDLGRPDPPLIYQVRWKNGGPGVVKGVASLPADMRAALQVALE
jgi:hypothetical protein